MKKALEHAWVIHNILFSDKVPKFTHYSMYQPPIIEETKDDKSRRLDII